MKKPSHALTPVLAPKMAVIKLINGIILKYVMVTGLADEDVSMSRDAGERLDEKDVNETIGFKQKR